MFKEISVVFPAFNEQGNILKAVSDANLFLKKNFQKYEIIVVNNGSRDKTKPIVQKLQKTNKHIKLVNLTTNQGYGSGLRAGFTKAKYQLVFYTDSDNQFDIKEIKLLMPYAYKYDLICGYRKKRQDPQMRLITAGTYNLLINFLFGLWMKDIDCAFKLYNKKVFDTIKLHANTGLIDAEVLLKARKAGFSFSPQLGVSHYPRLVGATTYEGGVQGLVKPQVVIDIFAEIKKLWKELR